MTTPDLTVLDAPADGPQAQLLIAELQQYYVQVYGGEDRTPVAAAEFAPPEGVFVLARVNGELAGCAALRRHDPGSAEVKRLYIRAGFRRLGLARRLMATLEDRARELGYQQLVLETGSAQLEAVRLYEALGYRRTDNFGFHQDSPSVRSFVRPL